MKTTTSLAVTIFVLTVSSNVRADSLLLFDAPHGSVGIGAGQTFGQGNVRIGLAGDAYHGNSFKPFRPDLDAYGLIDVSLPAGWFFLGHLGAGATFTDTAVAWSARSFLVLASTGQVAFRTSNFIMWTPSRDSVYVEQKIGPSIRLFQTAFRIFPYAAVSLAVSGPLREASVAINPGCTLFFLF